MKSDFLAPPDQPTSPSSSEIVPTASRRRRRLSGRDRLWREIELYLAFHAIARTT